MCVRICVIASLLVLGVLAGAAVGDWVGVRMNHAIREAVKGAIP